MKDKPASSRISQQENIKNTYFPQEIVEDMHNNLTSI